MMSHEVVNMVGPIVVAVVGFGAGAMLCFGLVAELAGLQRRRSTER